MKLYCISRGNPQNPALILLHGLLGMSDFWIPLINKWEKNFFVLAPDLRNHGRSPHVDNSSYEAMVDDIVELFSSNKIPSAHVIGHSMGGKVAMVLAFKYPSLLDSLVVVDMAPVKYEELSQEFKKIFYIVNHFAPQHYPNLTEIYQTFVLQGIEEKYVQLLLKNIRKNPITSRFEWKFNLSSLLSFEKEFSDFPIPVTQSSVPTLFIRGSLSSYLTENHVPIIHQYFPQNQIVTIPNAGHWVHVDQPDLFFNICNHFLIKVIQKKYPKHYPYVMD
ncbi:MAG: alpha/beta fold hydrolase [Bacteroidales bacterium]|nr:alpha/beta fold hydrolase [Bacteroidales bacterium]